MAAPSPADDVTLTFGGNATTLLRLGPFTHLTVGIASCRERVQILVVCV